MIRVLTLVLGGLGLAFAASNAVVSVRPERPAIVAGEPLLFVATVKGLSASDVKLSEDPYLFPRVTQGMGVAVESPHYPLGEHMTKLAAVVGPGEEASVRIVAGETAQLRAPGEYFMTVHFPFLGLSSDLRFTVLPADPVARARRADEFYAAVIGTDVGATRRAVASLEAMDAAISAPRFCALLKRERGWVGDPLLANRLEQIGSPVVIDCLIELLPKVSTAEPRAQAAAILGRIAQRTSDSALCRRIQQALAGD
jgi:hypothetical protein